MTVEMERLTANLARLAKNEADSIQMQAVATALNEGYDLANKIAREGGLAEIIQQLFARLLAAYDPLSCIKGKRILDIACGSSTSKAPVLIHVKGPFGKKTIHNANPSGFTAQFEPWFCRMLLELEAQPVGVDIGDLQGETFEHYQADLGVLGALDFLPSQSFDGVQDSRLFGSPEFTKQFPRRADRKRIAEEIVRQERRLLKPGGIVIHSDAKDLIRSVNVYPPHIGV
jgi:SAM-dependent methyltransferase